jgi:hypothetical protein
MCGRYRRTTSEEELARLYHIPIPCQTDILISYNIASSQKVLTIRFNPETEDGNLKELLVPCPADQTRMWNISPQGKQRGRLMIHRSGNPLMAEIGRPKKEMMSSLGENKLKGLFLTECARRCQTNRLSLWGYLRLIKQVVLPEIEPPKRALPEPNKPRSVVSAAPRVPPPCARSVRAWSSPSMRPRPVGGMGGGKAIDGHFI